MTPNMLQLSTRLQVQFVPHVLYVRNLLGIIRGVMFILITIGSPQPVCLSTRLQVQFVPRVRNLLGIIRGILFILIRLGVLSLSPLSIRLQVQFVRYVPNLLGIVHVAVRLLPSTQWRTSLSCFSTFACSRRSSNQSTELHGYAQDRIYVSTRPHSFSLVSVRFHSCVLGWGHYLDSPLRG